MFPSLTIDAMLWIFIAIIFVALIVSVARQPRLRPATIQIDHATRTREIRRRADSLRDLLREDATYVKTLRDIADEIESAGAIAVLDLTTELPHNISEGTSDEDEAEHRPA